MKRHVIILLIVSCIAILVYYLLQKLNPMNQLKSAFKTALENFPAEIVENCERLYRLETNHFKSGQYLGTYSPGMEKFGESYPFGWNTIHKVFWSKNPQFKPVGFKTFTENGTGKQKTFLKFFNPLAGVMTVCAFLQHYGNNPGRWYSLKPDSQNRYNESIKKIKPTIVYEQLA